MYRIKIQPRLISTEQTFLVYTSTFLTKPTAESTHNPCAQVL